MVYQRVFGHVIYMCTRCRCVIIPDDDGGGYCAAPTAEEISDAAIEASGKKR